MDRGFGDRPGLGLPETNDLPDAGFDLGLELGDEHFGLDLDFGDGFGEIDAEEPYNPYREKLKRAVSNELEQRPVKPPTVASSSLWNGVADLDLPLEGVDLGLDGVDLP